MISINSEARNKNKEGTMTQLELRQFLKLSNTGFWRLDKAGLLPPSFKLGARRRWSRATVEKWINEQECKGQ